MKISDVWNVIRPMAASALFLLCSAAGLQLLASQFFPSFSILASKDLGKIIFTTLIFIAIGGFVVTRPHTFRTQWLETNFGFFLRPRSWLPSFFSFFIPFFCLHAALLALLWGLGYATYDGSVWNSASLSLAGKLAFGFFATFMLALTEEIMFRGTIYPYLALSMRPLNAALATSLLFMLVHDLTNPLRLITTQWRLGLGLFLLGLLLNLVRIITDKLYTGMGIHAGLVFVKVILRKARFLILLPEAALPWVLSSDLRCAPLVHLLFALIIGALIVWQWKMLTLRTYPSSRG